MESWYLFRVLAPRVGRVWECLRSVETLGISRAAVVRFAERTGGVAIQLYPAEPAGQPAEQPAGQPAGLTSACLPLSGAAAAAPRRQTSPPGAEPRGERGGAPRRAPLSSPPPPGVSPFGSNVLSPKRVAIPALARNGPTRTDPGEPNPKSKSHVRRSNAPVGLVLVQKLLLAPPQNGKLPVGGCAVV